MQERITTTYDVMLGKPTITGTRITVELVLRKLAQGANKADLIAMYPSITELDINACFEYAANLISNESFA
jgi:uncharacterized protein (DUF433 family)